jgi:hypothetical protein
MLDRVGASPRPAAVGVADHSGWADMVTVAAGDGSSPIVVDRRRCRLVDGGMPRQAYHAAAGLAEEEAQRLVARVTDAAQAGAGRALDALVADLAGAHAVVAVALRAGGGRPLPATVAAVLASHAAMHAAEGQIYRDAFAGAAGDRGMIVGVHPRGDAIGSAASRLGIAPDRLSALVAALGRPLGPPWRKEHRDAAAAALGELSDHTPLALGG